MTTDTGAPGTDAPGPTAAPSEPAPTSTPVGPLRLTRSRTDRKVAGVCGGLGAYTGVDPVVFRVVVAVSAVLGGAGLLAYILAWVILPEATEDGDEPHVPRTHPPRLDLLLLMVVGLAALHLLSRPWEGRGTHIDLAPVLVAAGAWWWWRRREERGAARENPVGDAPAAPLPADPGASRLPRLTFSAVVLTAGIFTALAAGGVEVDTTVALATCLLVGATGLLVSSWYGSRHGLLLLCGLLAVATAVSGVADVPLGHGAGDRTWQPASAAELEGSYRLGAGHARLDLGNIHDLHGTRHVDVSLGLGDLQVTLPADAAATVRASAGVGDVDVFGRTDDGADVHVTRTVTGDADGRLVVDVHVGAGHLTVVR